MTSLEIIIMGIDVFSAESWPGIAAEYVGS